MLDSVEIEIYFSPKDDVNGKIVDYINKANQSISFVILRSPKTILKTLL
jgi:hypothetical protein